MKSKINIRSKNIDGVEVSWFAPICNGDDEILGSHSMDHKSNWDNTSKILLNFAISGTKDNDVMPGCVLISNK